MNQIIIGLSLLILLIGASYKVMTKKDEPLEEEKDTLDVPMKSKKFNTTDKKTEEVKKRVINDHMAEIMNIKKSK